MCPRRRCFSLHRDICTLSFSVTVVFCVTFLARLSLVGRNTGEGKISPEDAGSPSLAETMAVRRERVVSYCKLKQPAAEPARGGGQISYQNRYLCDWVSSSPKSQPFKVHCTQLFQPTATDLHCSPDHSKTVEFPIFPKQL